MAFSLEKANLLREDTFRRKHRFEVMFLNVNLNDPYVNLYNNPYVNLNDRYFFLQTWLFTSGDWSHADYSDILISCLE